MNARGQGRGRWKGQRSRGRSCYSHYGSRGRGHTRGGLNAVNNLIPSPLSQLCQSRIEVVSPYQGWKLYFPDEAYSEQSSTVGRVKTFQKFFFNSGKHYDLNEIEMAGYFIVSFKEMVTHEIILDEVPNLLAELQDMPEKIIACLGLAMHQILTKQRKNGEDAELATEVGAGPFESGTYSIPIVHARIVDYNTIVPLKHIKANYYGKCVSVKGTVVRVSNVKPFCLKMGFECNSCETLQTLLLSDGKYAMPTKCSNRECRSKAFIPRRNSSFTETVDWQTIRVQELIGDDQKESGRIPRTIDCELSCDLANSCLFGFFAQVPLPPPKDLKIKVDSCVPGDIVTVVGIVKVNSSEEGRGRNKDKCLFLLYIQANSVSNSKGSKCSSGDPGYGMAMDFTMKELYAIQEIQSEKNLFRLLVGSLCSSIYGHEMVKAGLLLGLFGGTQKFGNDKNRIPVRGDPHVLVVGDPGLGKSQMLQSVANVAPRSVYVCGNTTTTSGLTVTLSKDGGSNDHALEAGALVLADQGCCCIDEFDKMGNQHQALLEAMEQQSISIAKAGIVCSLPARSSIIAAANPVGGHYNKSKTVSENLKMGGALLSRFDLVFILLDKPDEEMDSMLSEYVMALHAGKQKALTGVCVRRHNQTKSQDTDESRLQWEMDKPLSEKLKILRGEQMDLIPSQLLRKYVGYARKYVHPHIGLEAAKVLQNFYLDLRRRHQTQDSTPITTRQLESLIRLTEARARLELREEATQTDAEDVIEIMRYSMRETYSDQFGLLDFQRSQHGSGMSGRSKPKKFISALQRISNQTYNSLFTISQMRQIARDIGLQTLDFEGFISSLNNQGFLLKRGPKVYQLQTTDY